MGTFVNNRYDQDKNISNLATSSIYTQQSLGFGQKEMSRENRKTQRQMEKTLKYDWCWICEADVDSFINRRFICNYMIIDCITIDKSFQSIFLEKMLNILGPAFQIWGVAALRHCHIWQETEYLWVLEGSRIKQEIRKHLLGIWEVIMGIFQYFLKLYT